MKKKKILIAALLVNMVMAVFGTDFEERINEKTWLREYFNEVIYRKDRDIILEYQDSFKVRITDYEPFYDETFWYSSLFMFWDTIECFRLIDNRNVYKIGMDKASFNYKVNKINQNLYEIQIEDIRITQRQYEEFLEDGHDMKFALDATEPEYSFYFRFDGDYLYIYLKDGKTLYETYCAYDEAEADALYSAICFDKFDKLYTRFTFPRHADGTCEFETKEETGAKAVRIEGGWYLAAENLRLRKDADISSEIITTMQAGTLVEILSTGKEDTIDGITGDWVKIQVVTTSFDKDDNTIKSGTVGWCFGGYLK